MSSLAGCLGTDDDDDELKEGQYGTVMVSTYHIGEIVKAIAGDTVNLEMINTDNTPIHDYEPEQKDLIRLGESDLFLYHGLGLEPWVDEKIADLGAEAPPAKEVHVMPTGEIDLDFKLILADNLCDLLNNPSAEVIHVLSEDADESDEIHGDDAAYNLGFPEEDHHDDDHHEDEHNEEGHEGHDHGEQEMVSPEDEITEGLEECPSNTVVSIYHFEEGEYLLEFEAEDVDSFKMAIAQMGGAHNHDHGEEDEDEMVCYNMGTHTVDDSYTNQADCEGAGLMWTAANSGPGGDDGHHDEMSLEEMMEEVDENNDGKMSWDEFEDMWNNDRHDDEHHDEEDHDDEHHDDEHHDNETHDDEHHDDEHHDNETHDDEHHDDEHHDDEHHDDHHDEREHDEELEEAMNEYMMSLVMDIFTHSDEDGDTLLDLEELEHFIEEFDELMEDMEDSMPVEVILIAYDDDEDGKLSLDEYMHFLGFGDEHGDEHHDDDHHDERMFHCSSTVGGTPDTEIPFSQVNDGTEDCGDGSDEPQDFDDDGTIDNWFDCSDGSTISMELVNDGTENCPDGDDEHHDDEHHDDEHHDDEHHDDDHHDNETHDDDHHDDDHHDNETHDDDHHDEENHTMDDMLMAMIEEMFNSTDLDGDGYLNSSELEVMMEEMMEEDHEEGVAYIHLHVEREGEYGIALPDSIELHVLSSGGHGGHGHEEHNHGEEDDDDETEEDHSDELKYDPHSWLDPVAYAAQVDLVLEYLIDAFPEGEDVFKANANAYKAELVKLDEKFDSLTDECENPTVVANHNAYSYMAYRYDIQFLTLHGLDPEGEPTVEDIANVIEHIEEEDITVLYVEEYTDQSSVQSIIDATGVEIKILYTMEMAPMDSDDNYLSLMEKNFENLEAGLSCSA